MADPKISALNSGTELTAPAVGDLLASVDISDTTEAATGTTKPLRIDNLTNSGIDRIICIDNEVVCVDNQVVYINE